jgi:hypothetical protein
MRRKIQATGMKEDRKQKKVKDGKQSKTQWMKKNRNCLNDVASKKLSCF